MSCVAPVEALLFDLGGVVIEIDLEQMLDRWEPHSLLTRSELRRRLAIDEAYCRHERGEIPAATYMRHLARVFEIDADPAVVAAGWNAMLVKPIAVTLDWIGQARRRLPCFAFSNTSTIHRDVWSARFPAVGQAFDRLFLSCELGLRKPERAAFEAVISAIGKPADAILFFDDTPENVDAARTVGLQTVLVEHPQDVAAGLAGRGLLNPPDAAR